ncbi:GntR family transcriptional regulator [Marasmitruncus massiliensis]|uniref:GntR family transcriptional regulator n=1 Tax=Marasmitruncus massiliensis TaxID=1944642 RepID=UPI000C7C7520|nr:GntR family transcriptional regulator [Marasmitruncus massiliensis]
MEAAANLKDTAYKFIKDKVLNCEFYPGQEISEKQIAETIGAGRTPVREALLMLQKENLIEIYPRSSTRVKRILPEETAQTYQIRKLIEPTVAIKYKNQMNSIILLNFEKRFDEMKHRTNLEDERQFYSLDIEFHQFIVDTPGNARLSRYFHELMQDTYRVGILSMLQHRNSTRQETLSEHRRIIRAILMEDDREIEAAFAEHINHSLLSSLETLKYEENPD